MEIDTPEAAFARLESAMVELCGTRERLAEGLEEALGTMEHTMARLELVLNQPRTIEVVGGVPLRG